MSMPKTALIAALMAAASIGGVTAAAPAASPSVSYSATTTPDVDPCVYGVPFDATVVGPDGKLAPGHCPLAVIPWGPAR